MLCQRGRSFGRTRRYDVNTTNAQTTSAKINPAASHFSRVGSNARSSTLWIPSRKYHAAQPSTASQTSRMRAPSALRPAYR